MTRPYCVGLTGGIGSGKSLVASGFAALGVDVIDTDVIARQLTGPSGRAMTAIAAAFGDVMRCPDGSLDRPSMRERVFADPVARRNLEAILHPLILDQAGRELKALTAPYVLLVVPLLVESGTYAGLVDRVLVVDCLESQQVERAMTRQGMTAELLRAIMASQASRVRRLAAADDILDNRGTVAQLERQIAQLHRNYLDLGGKSHA